MNSIINLLQQINILCNNRDYVNEIINVNKKPNKKPKKISNKDLPKYLPNKQNYILTGNTLDINKVCVRWNEYVDAYGANHNKKFDNKQVNCIRIVTYNIRFGEDRCNSADNHHSILLFVEKVKPDIICFQEVPMNNTLTKGGYNIKPYFGIKRFNNQNANNYFKREMINKGYLYDYCYAGWVIGNAIYYKNNLTISKNKFTSWPNKITKKRCMTGIKYKNTNIITTHLEIDTLTRLQNAQDFVGQIQNNNIDLDNTIILGDFNSTIDSNIMNLFKSNKLVSAFDNKSPPTTSLFDEVVDHILIPNNYKNKVKQCDICLIKHSDHFPIILDIEL